MPGSGSRRCKVYRNYRHFSRHFRLMRHLLPTDQIAPLTVNVLSSVHGAVSALILSLDDIYFVCTTRRGDGHFHLLGVSAKMYELVTISLDGMRCGNNEAGRLYIGSVSPSSP